jgi:hypothetical protein
MSSIPDIADAMQDVLTTVADEAARETRFVQRASKITGALFIQTLVFGFLANPRATLDELARTAAALGLSISAPGLFQRFGETAAACLKQVLAAATQRVIAADPVAIPLLQRFTGVIIQDSSTIVLPPILASIWRGCGGSTDDGNAAVKLQVQLDLCTGALVGLDLQHGRDSDRQARTTFRAGALYLADLGYFALQRCQEIARAGAWWLTRWYAGTALYDTAGKRWDDVVAFLEAQECSQVDVSITLGAHARVPCRLIAFRVPQEVADQRRRRLRAQACKQGRMVSERSLRLCGWTILVTNVPPKLLSSTETLVLARTRWQIELLFKLWKSHGAVDDARSGKPEHVLCAMYAKLLAMVVQHWVMLTSLWAYPDRSLAKAAQEVQKHARSLATAFAAGDTRLALETIARCIAGCRMNRRRTQPNTHQLLEDISLLEDWALGC